MEKYNKHSFYFSSEEIEYLKNLSVEEFWDHISKINDINNESMFKNIHELSKIIFFAAFKGRCRENILDLFRNENKKKTK